MIKLLSKIFIKDYTNYKDSTVRHKYGILCGSFGIFLNFLLFAGKLLAGTITKSVAMTADAFNNLSDAASSLVQILGFKLSSKKADIEHPFGHGRMEYISGLIISFLIILMGFELLKSSVLAIKNPEPVKVNALSLVIMISAIFIKVYIYAYNHIIGKKIDSVSMEAVAKDALSDCVSTSVVILASVLAQFTTFPVDGIAGCIVAVLILYTGYDSTKETIAPLLGKSPSKEFVDEIEEELLKHKPIVAMHDLIVHDYGPGRTIISLHAEVPGDQNIFDLHDVIDNAEIAISRKLNCQTVIHMDPIDTKNEQLSDIKVYLKTILPSISEGLSIHDVRMVPGNTHTNLIFDVVKPFECKLSDCELKNCLSKKIKEKYNEINCVITVDACYTGE